MKNHPTEKHCPLVKKPCKWVNKPAPAIGRSKIRTILENTWATSNQTYCGQCGCHLNAKTLLRMKCPIGITPDSTAA